MKKSHSYLHSFRPILPDHCFNQDQLIQWVIAAHQRNQLISGVSVDERLKRFAVNDTYIKNRYSDYGNAQENWEEHEIYQITSATPGGMDIKKRNEFFSKVTLERFHQIYSNQSPPEHIIHVTCTGYISPSAPQLYFSNSDTSPNITHAYHMGCYASLPAIRMASAFTQEKGATIDIVHNEICSIHFNPTHHIPEQIVVQTLFADGHIFYQVNCEEKGFRILGLKEKIIPNTSEEMSWIPSPLGMSMTLCRKVPQRIESSIIEFVMELASELKLDLSYIIKHGIFAIHPGGPKIIEVVKNKLELRDDQIIESKKVLFERGNMSSATLPHIWHNIFENNYPSGTPIISLAFGPGLTVFGSVFEVV